MSADEIPARVARLELELEALRAAFAGAARPAPLLSLGEAAERIGKRPGTVYVWLERPDHPMHGAARKVFSKVGRTWKTDERRLARLVDSQCSTARGNGR